MSPEPVTITITYADGTTKELRRAGLLPDVFASEDGYLYDFKEKTLYMHGGWPHFRYNGTLINAKYAVADAWIPDWECQGKQIVVADGNKWNVAAENLAIVSEAGKGPPRTSAVYTRLKVLQLLKITSDLADIAEALDIPVSTVRKIQAESKP